MSRKGCKCDPIIVVPQIVDEQPKPWGFWATVGLSLAVIGVFCLVQTVVAVGFIVVSEIVNHTGPSKEFLAHLDQNGLLLSLMTWTTLPFTLGLIWLLVKIRKPWSPRDYLALRCVSIKTNVAWLAIVLLIVAAYGAAAKHVGHKSDFMSEIYKTAGFVPLLWLTLVVAAPLFEETLFRGFMFRGIQASRLGNAGAVVLTSLAWMATHVQYGVFDLAFIFILGIAMGIARARFGSVYLTMAMHAMLNFLAFFDW